MSDLRPRGISVTLDGVERHILFTLNVINEMEDKFGKPLSDIMEDILQEDISGHTLRDVMVILINDEVSREKYKNPDCGLEPVTEQEVGWLIGLDNRAEMIRLVLMAYGVSLPEAEEDDPNQIGGQQNN